MANEDLKDTIGDLYFFSLSRVIEAIYYDEDLSDVLYFIVNLAAELTGGMGSTLRVLGKDFDLRLVASHGLSKSYLEAGAVDYGKSILEIQEGDILFIKDVEKDPRVQNKLAAQKEGIRSVIGIPSTVDENTYCVMRVYFSDPKVPYQDEVDFLIALLRLACIAIHRAASLELANSSNA